MPPSPYFADPDVTLYCGDALSVLRELPDGSVHCAVTSPPFFGLRDYGTGTWEGGDEGCGHAPKMRPGSGRADGIVDERGQRSRDGAIAEPRLCGKCGARRIDSQIGLESSPDEWAARLVEMFREVRRVLRDDATLWVECGDSYVSGQGGRQSSVGELPPTTRFDRKEAGTKRPGLPSSFGERDVGPRFYPGRGTELKPKDVLGQPWLLAFALRADGWYLRSCIVWSKPNPMPESVSDRPTTAHSYVFLLSKRPRYFYDAEKLREDVNGGAHSKGKLLAPPSDGAALRGGHEGWSRYTSELATSRNARSVWTIATEPNALAICRVCDAFWERGAPREHCGQPVVHHFAAFPRELVCRMILAGTSERGVCAECGAPWVREMSEPPNIHPGDSGRSKAQGNIQRGEGRDDKAVGTIIRERFQAGRERQTLGWNSSCECDCEPVPATILDPFAGSGTSLLVARSLGRHAVGIELNERYCAMTRARLAQLSLLADVVS